MYGSADHPNVHSLRLTIADLGLQVLDNVIMTRWKVLPRDQCMGELRATSALLQECSLFQAFETSWSTSSFKTFLSPSLSNSSVKFSIFLIKVMLPSQTLGLLIASQNHVLREVFTRLLLLDHMLSEIKFKFVEPVWSHAPIRKGNLCQNE